MDARTPFLETTDEVIDALGGNGPAGDVVGASSKAVSNWRVAQRGKFPPETFIALNRALQDKNLRASPGLWGMIPAATSALDCGLSA